MTLAVDTSRAIRGRLAQLRLVGALRDAPGSEAETDYIEWKSDADIQQKRWWFEAARHILGFSNREPAHARTWFEGTAYLLFGVEPGRLVGTRVCDPADIDKWVTAYTGDDPASPRWSLDYVTVDDKPVLMFTVEASAPGETIHTLRKAWAPQKGPSASEGDIYVRKRGRTERADAADIGMLVARARGGQAVLNLAVVTEPEDRAIAIDDSREAVDRWVAPQRAELLAGLKSQPAMHFTLGEPRSPDRFIHEVETWANSARAGLRSDARENLVSEGVGDVRFRIENPTVDNFGQVIVEVTFEDPEVEAYWVPGDVPGPRTGRRPHPWGDGGSFSLDPTFLSSIQPVLRGPRPTIRRDTSGRCVVELVPVDVRPNSLKTLEAVTVIAPASAAGGELRALWRVTAAAITGDQRGETVVPVRDAVVALNRLVDPS